MNDICLLFSAAGYVAVAEDGELLVAHQFPKDPEIIARIYSNLKKQFKDDAMEGFLSKLAGLDDSIGNFVAEDPLLARFLSEALNRSVQVVKGTMAGNSFRKNVGAIIDKIHPGMVEEDFFNLNRKFNLELTRQAIKTISGQEDKLIMQAVNSIDDVNKSLNIFSERIREWYGLHFPELTDQLVSDHEFFLEIIKEIGFRDGFNEAGLLALRPLEERQLERIIGRAEKSMGSNFSPFDMKVLQQFTSCVLGLYQGRRELEDYVDTLMRQTCPNITAIIGPLLGARLICLAGGLKNLAMKPSSTVQVLGAEKALFRSLQSDADPPKHGVIFQAKQIRTAPYWQRGKIARLLAGKLSIAAKVDHVSKRDISEELSTDIEDKIQEINRKYPEKPEKTRKQRSPPPSRRSPSRRPPSTRPSKGQPRKGGGGRKQYSKSRGNQPRRRQEQ